MQPKKRRSETGVVARLLEQPQRFTFVQAITILLKALARRGISHEAAFREVIRFSNNLSLSFPASEVQALKLEHRLDSHGDSHGDSHVGNIRQIRLTPAFIGLLGTAGTLPLHDSERLAEQQQRDRDASQYELINVFSNRMIGLFYDTWGKYRVEHGLRVRGRDALQPLLLALAGHGARTRAPSRQDNAAAYYAGILRTRPVSASAIARILRDHFSVPICLEQFVGCWDRIPSKRRSTFGANPIVLGRGAALGTRLWRHGQRARLHIGPLDETQMPRFLPGGSARGELAEMMALFAVPMIDWEINLLLASPCVRRLRLTNHAAPRQLGWTSFLTQQDGNVSRAEVASLLRLAVSPMRRDGP